jgi:predicted DNA-binding transcriptional regulator AlpA
MKTVIEISKMFGVSRIAVYNWIKDGLPHSREKVIGVKTRVVINPSDVIEYHKSKEKRGN